MIDRLHGHDPEHRDRHRLRRDRLRHPPAGINWTIDGAANGWSIVAGVLTFGPADLAAGASAAVHIVGTTDAADCGLVPNTVIVDALNE